MLQRSFGDVLKGIGKQAAIDAGKLGLDTLAHDIVAKSSYDPDKSPLQIIQDTLNSALTGALMGGFTRAAQASPEGRVCRRVTSASSTRGRDRRGRGSTRHGRPGDG